jgi:short-subunit dehydrogenase
MNIIITGASSGIGFATALQLAENPANKIIAIARDSNKLANLVNLANEKYGYCCITPLTLDLQQQDFSKLHTEINLLGEIHILINNAGALINKPFAELSEIDWLEMFTANVLSAVKMSKLVATFMGFSQRGHIVNIGSMGGFQGSAKFAGLSAYSASKAALANLTECFAAEYSHKNIACNCLALGAVQTEMLAKAFPSYQAPINSEEIAKYIAFFCQHGQYFQNGKIIPLSLSTP